MFNGAKKINKDISRWNVDQVENMHKMFGGAEKFNKDLSGWNVEKCENMEGMFRKADKFNKFSVNNWDLSGKNINDMFIGGYPGENGETTMKKYKKGTIW